LQLRNAQLAELQSQGAEEEVDLTLAESAETPPEEPSAPVQEEPADATGREDASAVVEDGPEAVAGPAEGLAEPAAEPAELVEAIEQPAEVPEEPGEAPVEIEDETTEPPEVAVTSPETSGAKPEVAPPQTADTPPAPQPVASEVPERPFWDSVPTSTLGLAVGVPLLVLASGLLLMRRRKRLRESLDWEFTREPGSREIADAELVAVSSHASALGGTRESEQIERSATPYSGLSNLEDETEEADVLSEADVYIAYGRYREAESLLKEEIERSPERLDLKTKLAEAYYGSRNGDALQAIIEDMRRIGGDRISPDQWQRLAAMVNELQGTTVIDLSEAEPASPEPRQEPAPIASEVDETDVVSASVPEKAPIGGADERPGDALELDIEELAFDDRPAGRPEPSEPPLAAAPEFELKLEDLDEFGSVDLEGLESGTRKSEPVPGRISLEPAESVLELPSTTQDAVTAEDILSSQWEMDSGPADEAATKIDLARAYLEMEDPDAARAILEEVVEEGNAAQRAEARAMLEQLS
jgi:pilus assembly protein FimV